MLHFVIVHETNKSRKQTLESGECAERTGNHLQYRLWHSESSSAVTLLLHADWMMLKNASNQGEQTA